jgi:hypothetical protein
LLNLEAKLRTVPPEKFNMLHWCGTAQCVAGWATTVVPELRPVLLSHPSSGFAAFADAFGLSLDESYDVCGGDFHTPIEAADAVGRLAQKYSERDGHDIVETAS